MSSPDVELAAEQEHLDLARAELGRMREAAEALDASRASDAVSGEVLSRVLARRIVSLRDDPRTTLFFGRIDTGASREHPGGETFHIGRRHVSDGAGEPVVVDWRAPISGAFYRASVADPMGVVRRRRFGVEHGRLTAFEDEQLAAGTGAGHSALLAAEIERPRTGPMRDIVSTIQPEQDEIVRSDVGTTICVQGAPGTGKTAVGLHRAAWLLYSFRERLDRAGVLVIGPNRAFLDHIGAVLPSLGEVRVGHATIESLVGHRARLRAEDSPPVATLKGDSRLATVLRRAVWSSVRRATEPLVVPRGVRKWRVPAYEVQDVLDELVARDVRYEAARALLPQRLAHHVLLAMEASGDAPDDRVQDSVATSGAVRAYVASVWPALDAAAVLHRLWSDPGALATAAGDDLTAAERAVLGWPRPPRTKGAARWSRADLVLLDELADLLSRTPSLGHVILDEAQDLSPMQLRAVGRRCSTGSATILGDLAQGTTPWATSSWSEAMAHLGKPAYELVELERGFRVPGRVLDFAARLLPHMSEGLTLPTSVRDNPGVLTLVRVDGSLVGEHLARLLTDRHGEPGSTGVIAADLDLDRLGEALQEWGVPHGRLDVDHGDDADHPVQLVPATVAKGLEFDRVVVVEPAAIAAAEPDERTGLRRLYVILTRAVSELTVLHADPLPGPLR